MPGETSGRPLLPQTAQMQSFAFAPPSLAPRENQRSESVRTNAERDRDSCCRVDYVFVDEHNRHKRLKGAAQQPCGPRNHKFSSADCNSDESM
jgi:hypothetical protein